MFANNQVARLNPNEIATAAQSQAAVAEIQTAYLMAYQMPRNTAQARVEILDSCKLSKFAESAMYRRPVGKKKIGDRWEQQYVEGLSIRAAEEILRAWGNIRTKVTTIYEDDNTRKAIVSVTDIQSNASYSDEITIPKTKEKKALYEKEIAISERRNSKDQVVYVVKATDEDIRKKQSSEVSRSIRNSVLRLIPVDIKEDVESAIKATLKEDIRGNINESRKSISDAFHSIGIDPNELEKYLGQKLKTITESQIIELRQLFTALKAGETSWKAVMEDVEREQTEKQSFSFKKARVKKNKAEAKDEAKSAEKPKKEEVVKAEPQKEADESMEYKVKIQTALLELAGGDVNTARKMLMEICDTDNLQNISEEDAKRIYTSKVKPALDNERRNNGVG